MAKVLNHNPLKSKSFWGAVLVAASLLTSKGVDSETLLQAIGTVVAAIGLRDATEKKKS